MYKNKSQWIFHISPVYNITKLKSTDVSKKPGVSQDVSLE
jgi:hypothetical protein